MRTIVECVEDIKGILNNAERTEEMDGETLTDIDELVNEILSINGMKESAKEAGVSQKNDTHIVIKREDVLKYLDEPAQVSLESILSVISKGRMADHKNPINRYYVVNQDEPYAELVHGIIIGGEAAKNKFERN